MKESSIELRVWLLTNRALSTLRRPGGSCKDPWGRSAGQLNSRRAGPWGPHTSTPCKGRPYGKARSSLPSDSYKSGPSIPKTKKIWFHFLFAYIFGCKKPLFIATFNITVPETFRRETALALGERILITCGTIKIRQTRIPSILRHKSLSTGSIHWTCPIAATNFVKILLISFKQG